MKSTEVLRFGRRKLSLNVGAGQFLCFHLTLSFSFFSLLIKAISLAEENTRKIIGNLPSSKIQKDIFYIKTLLSHIGIKFA